MSLVALDEEKFSRSIHTFACVEPRLFIQSDTCLFGLCILVYAVPDRDILLGGSAVDISHFGFGEDSSFQNVAEFVAAVMGIVMIIKMGLLFMTKDYGDFVTALTWISNEKYRGLSVANAAMVHTITPYWVLLAVRWSLMRFISRQLITGAQMIYPNYRR